MKPQARERLELRAIKDFVRSRPRLYDTVRNLKRSLTGSRAPSFSVLEEFSRRHGGRINFIQIGANDGLRNDPLRPLVVRDDWQGVFVEPLPTVFPLLKSHYAYLRREGLVFLNAAVTVDGRDTLDFWSFREAFLAGQSTEQRLDYLRKASFERDHVVGFLPPGADPRQCLERVPVPCLTVERIVAENLPRQPLHLLAIDAEGYEATLIPGLDFEAIAVEAVFFESEHLGAQRERVMDHLETHGFRIRTAGLDSFATR
ncbi:hypothetical protein CSA17_04470 [bacterium DOLJORAL78_65_58]|nr:MAG: hypothetical protein CSB20_08170 [bacterium DOLZORAL124_64_63]PIE76006.1 MAG: hypothetical protein CSA17_04470 [bacterium DOLJORAL78_65_58]